MSYDQVLTINGNKLTKKYIQSLSKQERLDIIDPIFQEMRKIGWLYPDDFNKVKKEWQRLLDFQPDLNTLEIFNNSSLATNICKYFCHSFYHATEPDKPTLMDNFHNDTILKRIIQNRLGLDWLESDNHGP